MKQRAPVMKNVTVRMPEEQVKHLKKRAREQRHRRIAKVLRGLVERDMSGPWN